MASLLAYYLQKWNKGPIIKDIKTQARDYIPQRHIPYKKDTGPFIQLTKAAMHHKLFKRNTKLALHRFNLTKPICITLITVKVTALPLWLFIKTVIRIPLPNG